MCWRAQNSMNIDDKGSYATGMYAFSKQFFHNPLTNNTAKGWWLRRTQIYLNLLTHDRRFGASGAYTEEGETAVDGRLLGESLQTIP